MTAGRGVHCALQAANATGSDCAVDHVSANDSAEPVAKTRPPRTRSHRGREPAGEKDDGAAEGEGDEHVAVPEEVRVQETQDQQHRHSTHVDTPGRDGPGAHTTRLHDDADAKQHGEDRDELPVGEQQTWRATPTS